MRERTETASGTSSYRQAFDRIRAEYVEMPGMRLTERRGYFQSGAGYPDCLVLDAGALDRGGDGVLAAGYFGNDWGLASGEFAWKK